MPLANENNTTQFQTWLQIEEISAALKSIWVIPFLFFQKF